MVAAVGEGHHPHGERHPGAAARSAPGLARIVGVAGRAEDRVGAVGAEAEFRHVGLADEQRARRPEAGDVERVHLRHGVAEERRAVGGADAGGGREVLDRVRQAVERPARTPLLELPVGGLGLGEERIGVAQGYDGVHRRVVAGDLVEMGLHHLPGRDGPVADGPREVGGTHRHEISGGHRGVLARGRIKRSTATGSGQARRRRAGTPSRAYRPAFLAAADGPQARSRPSWIALATSTPAAPASSRAGRSSGPRKPPAA